MTRFRRGLKVARTAALATLGVAAAVAASGALPAPYDRWAGVVLAVAALTGAYHATPPGTAPEGFLTAEQHDAGRHLAYDRGRVDQAAGRPHDNPYGGPSSDWLKASGDERKGPSHL